MAPRAALKARLLAAPVAGVGVVVVAAVVAALVIGAAASLSAASRTLGAASVNLPRCTTAGLGVVQNLSGSSVVSVTVSGLPSTCGTATLQVAVNDGAASSTGSAAVPVGGGSVTVILATAVAVSTAETTDLLVLGP
jgi:hypothetical protein